MQSSSMKSSPSPGSLHHPHSTNGNDDGTTPLHKHDKFLGFSLAFKVGLVTTGTLALLMGFLTYSMHRTTRDGLFREIDAFGVNLAKALATPKLETWDSTNGTLVQAAERVVQASPLFAEFLDKKYGIRFFEPVDLSKGSRDRVKKEGKELPRLSQEFLDQQRKVIEEYEKAKEKNQSRLSTLLHYRGTAKSIPSEVLDAFIRYEDRDQSVIRANVNAKVFRAVGEPRKFGVKDADGTFLPTDAVIHDGYFAGGRSARSYSYPIVDEEGNTTHRSYVFISKERIEERLGQQVQGILLLTFLCVLAGGGISHFITSRMTSPIMTLVSEADDLSSDASLPKSDVKTHDEIGLLARTMTAMVRRMNESRIRHDEEIVTEVHRKLVPEEIPIIPGCELDVLHRLSPNFGGAYYDILELPEKRWGLVITQASETGIAAALNVVMAGVLFHADSHGTSDPAEILRTANVDLTRDIRKGMVVNALIAVFDPKTHKLFLCGAGDLPFHIYRAKTGKIESLPSSGMPLGEHSNSRFDNSLTTRELHLEQGDRIVLHNGTGTQLENAKGDPLGQEKWMKGLERTCIESPESFIPDLRTRLNRYIGKGKVKDDFVILTLSVKKG